MNKGEQFSELYDDEHTALSQRFKILRQRLMKPFKNVDTHVVAHFLLRCLNFLHYYTLSRMQLVVDV